MITKAPFPPLKIPLWPAIDRDQWQRSQEQAGFLDDNAGFAAGWAPATRFNCERSYSMWLGWLERQSLLDSIATPRDRASKERLQAFLEEYAPGRAPLTVAGVIRDIAMVVRACSPPHGLPWLTKRGFAMVNRAKPNRAKLPRMADPLDLLNLGDKLMDAGLQMATAGYVRGAQRYRDGLLIAFLVHRPLRVKNLSYLKIGTSLQIDGADMRIEIKASDTKKGVPIDQHLPASLAAQIRTYIDHVRPLFLRKRATDDGWLWLASGGKRLPDRSIYTVVRKSCLEHLGKDISPHLFRDVAATQIAIDMPDHIGIAKDLLGHATAASSEKFYNQAGSFHAFRAHGDAIARLRAAFDAKDDQ